MHVLISCLIGLLALGASAEVRPWATPQEAQDLRRDMTAFFQGAEVRHPGTPGNLALEAKVAQHFEASGLEHGEILFKAPSFLPGLTTVTAPGQEPIRVFPLHPTLFRPGNFSEKEFSARLVYLGRGTVDDLIAAGGADLDGALAVMDFNCGMNWMRFLQYGVKGFIFIGGPLDSRADAVGKLVMSEISAPRFYVEAPAGLILKASAESRATVRVRAEPSRWENRTLRDLWVLIPGSDKDLSREVCVILAPMDCNSIVPDRATGAQSGANLYLLMQMMERFKKTPPGRSVLLAAVNGHAHYFLGERMIGWYLLSDGVEMVRDTLSTEITVQRLVENWYSRLQLETFRPEDERLLIDFRRLTDSAKDRNITLKDPLVALAKRDVNKIKTDLLILAKTSDLSKQEFEARRVALQKERSKYINILMLFNKVGNKTKLSDLSPEETRILKGYVDEIKHQKHLGAELNEQELKTDVANGRIREALKGKKISMVLSLELDWTNDQAGFNSLNQRRSDNLLGTRWNNHVARILADWPALTQENRPNLMSEILTARSGLNEQYYFPTDQSSCIKTFQAAQQTPALALQNVFTMCGRAFMADDTLDHLPIEQAAPLMRFIPEMLQVLLSDSDITRAADMDPKALLSQYNRSTIWAGQFKTYRFDELSASVMPEIPVPFSALILYHEGAALAGSETLGVSFGLTDERASVFAYSLSIMKNVLGKRIATAAFHYDPDFVRPDYAINAGDIQNKINSDTYSPQNKLLAIRMVTLFESQEFPLYALNDPSLVSAGVINIDSLIPLTATGNSTPRKYGICGVTCPMTTKITYASPLAAMYFSREEWIKLMTPDKRVALNATPKQPEGQGYASARELGPDLMANVAADMSVLNQARLAKLKSVADELAKEFCDRGNQALKRMAEARQRNDYLGRVHAFYEALGSHVKCYEQIKQTSDDMLKAVVVYMALLLPFCFFVQKLVFKFVKIEAQMGAFAVLFVTTFLVFRWIHPAFRVAQAAEAIFIAFVMGALGLFVISILYNRFQGEMQVLFQNYAEAATAVAYSTVGQKAMLIGVNNMKRRRIRTTLTTATIILITFTMLSFTSISKKMNPTILARGKDVPYTGLMYHWPGMYMMDENTLTVFTDLLKQRGQLVVRRWLIPKSDVPLHASASTGASANYDGLLGLATAEDGFLARMPMTAGRFFSSDDAAEIILSTDAAKALEINSRNFEGATVTVLGQDLKVVGILDDSRFRTLKDINGAPLIPIKRVVREQGAQEIDTDVNLTRAVGDKESQEEDNSFFYMDTSSLLIAPVNMAKQMHARPYSVSVKLKDTEPIWPFIDLILTVTRAKFFVSSLIPISIGSGRETNTFAPGIYYVGSNYKTSIGGISKLLIPLLIAATIILNTMLGSVYERKKEIAVYNAIGLNPHHIGMFFLAESFVYGVIGSVGGYLIGQVLSIILNRFGWIKDVNLNYSSLSVAYVILFTIVVVLLSTLYPAVVATKAAVPSGKRKWSLPPHDGVTMNIVFPFIYHPSIAHGVMAYLESYFSRFTEATIGDLIAERVRQTQGQDARGRPTYTLEYQLALAPYDLGVTQQIVFHLAFDDRIDAYRLAMNVIRVSGQDANWVTTNKPFLERLRTYLMHWRNLNAADHALHGEQARILFQQM